MIFNTLQMAYDKNGNPISLTDSKGNLMQWSYDTLDRATGKRYHDGTTEAYAYSGGLLSQTRGTRGQVVSYSYDANGNQTLIDYPNMADVSLSYNALDQVSQVSDGVGTHSFSYDDYGRLLSQSGPFANDTQTYAYDALQRIQAQSVGRGASGGTQSQSYAYDALGRLASLNSNGTQGVGTFAYHYVGLTGMMSRLDMPNGTHTDQSYDGLQRLTSVANSTNAGANLDRYAYAYSNRDIRTGVQMQHGSEAVRQVAYAYDGIDQLTGEQVTGGAPGTAFTKTYAYDAMGNRTQTDYADANQSVRTVSASNALNQLTGSNTASSIAPTTGAAHSYDAAGNLTQTLGSDGSKTLYTYDDADRLTRLERRNAAGVPQSASEWVYDYASRKPISREFSYSNGAWAQTSEKRRVFAGMDVVQERNAANEVTAQLVRSGNIGGILSRTTAAGASFYGYDGGGNVTLLTNENGQEVGCYRYDAFGNTLEVSGVRAAENPYRFSTKELHAASGLYDFGYRFYLASSGRWLNRDPLREAGGVNLYGMVENDPVNLVDEYGLVATIAIKGNKIDIYLPIQWKGPGATKDVIKRFTQSIESAWTGQFGKYQVTMHVLDMAKYDFPKWNVFTILKGNTRASAQLGGYYGTLYNENPSRTAAHESGHLMGLDDRYKDVKDKNGKTIGATAKDPNDKDWNKNIMGDHDQSPSEKDVTDIINYKYNDTRSLN